MNPERADLALVNLDAAFLAAGVFPYIIEEIIRGSLM